MIEIDIVDDPDMSLRVEVTEIGLIFHLDIRKKWSKRLRQKVKKHVYEEVNKGGVYYAWYLPGVSDPKLKKFINIIGGEYHHKIPTPEGALELYWFRPLK